MYINIINVTATHLHRSKRIERLFIIFVVVVEMFRYKNRLKVDIIT